MTLKNSFLTDMIENLKHRSWVFWISFLAFFCYFPGYLLLALNDIRADYLPDVIAESEIRMKTEMKQVVNGIFLVNPVMPLLLIGLAILIGIQGFSYLHNKRQVDFYHSQPVSRKRRFLVLWVNGIVIFSITYLANMLLGILVAAAFGTMTTAALAGAMKGFLLYLVFFLGIYHLAMIAVLLTGSVLVTILALGVFLGYELAVRGMAILFADSFFVTCGNSGMEDVFINCLSSPIMTIYKYLLYLEGNGSKGYGSTFGYLFFLAALFFAIAFFLYQRRKSESHGSSISFALIKEPVRLLLLVLIGLCGCYLIFFVAGESIVLAVAGGAFFVLLGHILIQVIYEVDFRAVRKNWMIALVSFAAAVLIFLGFRYDWTGYDYRIPGKSKVESVYLDLNEGISSYNSTYVLKDGTEMYRYSYVKDHMRLTDLDTVYELLENRELMKLDDFHEKNRGGTYEGMRVDFHLKNGRTQSRVLYIDMEKNLDVLDRIYHMEEFQTITNQVMEENFAADYHLTYGTYYNGEWEYRIPMDRVTELWEAYRKDVNNSAYKEVYYNLPVGRILFEGTGLKNKDYLNKWDVLIYESYENTLKILQEEGLKIKDTFSEEYINSIEKIQVQYLDRERYGEEGAVWSDCNKTLNYENKEQFAQILENALSESHRWWCEGGQIPYTDYTIMLYRKTSEYADPDIFEVFYQTGDLPSFIIKDLERVEFGEEKTIR